jgi:Xaa-Pro aminopeptidase
MKPNLDARRARVAAAWDLKSEIVLIGAGEPIHLPGGADQTYPFRSHSEYFYLTDRECAGGVLAFDPQEGWTDFVPDVTEGERVWEGRTPVEGASLTLLTAWLASRRGRPIVMLGCELPCVRADQKRTLELRESLTHARRPKDAVELERMRRAAAATVAGFRIAPNVIQAGASERDVQIEVETAFFRAGSDGTAYGTIVGSGTNAAVLHFSPTKRVIADGDLVLIDAGAEVERYTSDVTRTYAAGGFSSAQRDIYDIVLRTEERAIAGCMAGAEWRDVHMQASRDIAEGLVSLGLLRGDVEGLIEQDAHALFFPHGIGHMVGLGVRDASGFLQGRQPSDRPGLCHLRCDLPLEVGYVMTVEPGVYFIPALLNDPQRRGQYKDAVNWSRVDAMLNFGGIRIEDNVLVTEAGPEVLTAAIPKT